MTAYEELGRAIEEKDAEHGEETVRARNFAMRVVAEFQKQLGAPEDCVHLLPSAEVLKGVHEHHTIGESVERNGDGYTLGLEIDFPDHVTGVRMRMRAEGEAAWRLSVDGTGIAEVFTAHRDSKPFVTQVVDHLRKSISRHAPPEIVAFHSR